MLEIFILKFFLIFFRYNEFGGDGGGQFKVECVMDFGFVTGSGHTKVNFFCRIVTLFISVLSSWNLTFNLI